jgi:prevent-host-death family protein
MSVPLTRAKAGLSGLVERLVNLKEHIVITKHGKPVAALVPYEDWEKLTASEAGGLASVPPPAKDQGEPPGVLRRTGLPASHDPPL